jgi:ribonuclease III
LGIKSILKNQLTAEQEALSKAIFNSFGVKTKNIYIYQLAFRHKSVACEVSLGYKDSYERLEFLGDAVLGTVIAELLFKKYPFKSEGFLTNLRSKIVCGKFLTKISYKLGLDKLLHVQTYAGNTMNTSVMGDILEAVIGAVFMDKGFNYTKKMILERIVAIHVDIEQLVETETNFKSRLLEWAQKNKANLTYEVVETKTVKRLKQYVTQAVCDGRVFPEATHNSIKESEQLAAEKAIEVLKEEGLYENS